MNKEENKKPAYPVQICAECGDKYGHMDEDHVCTWWKGKCAVCGTQNATLTSPRDFGYPEFYK